jgi:hypothetical protein
LSRFCIEIETTKKKFLPEWNCASVLQAFEKNKKRKKKKKKTGSVNALL